LRQRGHRVAVLCRGYKARGDGENDETQLLRRSLPEVAVVVDPDRVRGGRVAQLEYQADAIVLDDGFQHRRLYRDIDIVMLDATNPFGGGRLLPAGLLRESAKQLRRADAVVLSRIDQISEEKLAALHHDVASLLGGDAAHGHKPIVYARHVPVGLYDMTGRRDDPAALRGRKVYAFCGIGNPESFISTLKSLGGEVVGRRIFSDHADYRESQVAELSTSARQAGADWLVTTEKDWVKLRHLSNRQTLPSLRWLEMELEIVRGGDSLRTLIDGIFVERGQS
jgi:tetraacyldisaccharide 4'-kinase